MTLPGLHSAISQLSGKIRLWNENQPEGNYCNGQLSAREWLDFATERVPQMQEAKMKETRGVGLEIAFTEGEQNIADPQKRSLQRPRVFYRRELEANPLVIAKP